MHIVLWEALIAFGNILTTAHLMTHTALGLNSLRTLLIHLHLGWTYQYTNRVKSLSWKFSKKYKPLNRLSRNRHKEKRLRAVNVGSLIF